MIEGFLQHIKQFDLSTKSKILLGVSGGLDSTVMLHLFHEAGFQNISVASCHFGLREEANDEIELVANTCKYLGVSFFVKRFNTADYANQTGKSIQTAARDLRYEWFSKLCDEEQIDFIMTAHHQDDQVETILMNIARGTGLKGLGGMPVQRGNIIRPMLFASKEMIQEYARANEIEYLEDASNKSDKYTRNFLRLNVIPELHKVNPEAGEHILALAERMRQMEMDLVELTDRIRSKYVQMEEDRTFIDLSEFDHWDFKNEVLHRILQDFNLPPGISKEAMKLVQAQSGKRIDFGRYSIVKDREAIIIYDRTEGKFESVEINENLDSLPEGFEARFISSEEVKFEKGNDQTWIDVDKVRFPLSLGIWEHGDKIRLFGMNGKQKVSDLLTQSKVPLVEKENTLVLKSGNEVVWVVGHRSSENFKIDDDTQRVLHIRRI